MASLDTSDAVVLKANININFKAMDNMPPIMSEQYIRNRCGDYHS